MLVLSGGAGAQVPAGEDPAASTAAAPSLSAPTTATVGTAREAWYQLTRVSTCSSPAGCLPAELPALPAFPVEPNVYPPDTLHVGWAAGAETARTYVQLDRASLPTGAVLVGGRLYVPLLADATSGTLLAEQAGAKACLVADAFDDGVAGELSAAPSMDCTVSSPFSLEAGGFTVDLAPFIEAWAGGATDHGLALTPFTSSSAASAWHLALPSRTAVDLPHIEARLDYAVPVSIGPAAPAALVVRPGQGVGVVPAQVPAARPVHPAAQARPPARPGEVPTAGGTTPFGWAVLAVGLLALAGVGIALRRPEPPG